MGGQRVEENEGQLPPISMLEGFGLVVNTIVHEHNLLDEAEQERGESLTEIEVDNAPSVHDIFR